MKIYLASGFHYREPLRSEAELLQQKGHEIVSSWIWLEGRPDRGDLEFDNFAVGIAALNIEELEKSDCVIVDGFGIREGNSGGVHFELGWAVGAGRRAILVGPRGNTFHWYDGVERYSEWGQLREIL